ncbi:DUF4412 domain-containing protein [Acetobacter thailandicus]|uniref:DUF4412 domain-containing protein n=1 Tax=Acetobacter thailandicus TaxID=1502842 RepID=UPI001BA58E76|nr:DUF4412 domain-containing protein [Acetobacter thailandicus]MBS0979365.1 DUF4412 domain-containing protein [Acetobacter thailandicus]
MIRRLSGCKFFLPTVAACFLTSLNIVSCDMWRARAVGAEAASQEHPPLTPARDATIDYVFQPRPPAGMSEAEKNTVPPLTDRHVQLLFSGDGGLMRIRYLQDSKGDEERGSVIMNRSAQEIIITLDARKIYTRLVQQEAIRNPFFLDLSMKFTPQGQDVIAGQPCTLWGVVSTQGKSKVCVTADGLILDYEGVDVDGLNGHLKAEKISYDPVPASAFEPPAGFHEFVPHRGNAEASGGEGGGEPSSPDSSAGSAGITGTGPGATGSEAASEAGEREGQ